ncbi:ankyrin repeat domain-containing protein [Aggregatibacter kilianii]|uniref:ankyrin repeat domain-containing protein n=1 Tax=Aggregatibacter kilianii TaxID=2025884 RepID=UPI000D65DFCA|nr:hypothetical protein [Aggregatibacter kilianii]
MQNNQLKFIRFLLENIKITLCILILGASMNAYTNDSERNERLLPEKYFEGKRLEMAKAIHQNDRVKVEKLLKNGLNVNELSSNNDGVTYLLYSLFLDDRFKIVELLLQHNADPNQVSKVLSENKKRYVYYLPLTFVSDDKPIEYMELLLKYGANPNYAYRDEKGEIPLYAMYPINAAVRSSYILNRWSREDYMNDIKARVELLLQHGADINSIGATGRSVVEFSLMNREIILYLMDKGADHRIYGEKLLRSSEKLLKANPNDENLKEIIRRLRELGYK